MDSGQTLGVDGLCHANLCANGINGADPFAGVQCCAPGMAPDPANPGQCIPPPLSPQIRRGPKPSETGGLTAVPLAGCAAGYAPTAEGQCCLASQRTKTGACCAAGLTRQPDGSCAPPPSQPQIERRCPPGETYRGGQCVAAPACPPPNTTPMANGECCPAGQVVTSAGVCCPPGQEQGPGGGCVPKCIAGWIRASNGQCCLFSQLTTTTGVCCPIGQEQGPDGGCVPKCMGGWARGSDGQCCPMFLLTNGVCCWQGQASQPNGSCAPPPPTTQPQIQLNCRPDEIYRDGRCWPVAPAPIIVPPAGVVVPLSPCAPGLVFRNGGCAPAVTAPIVVPPTGVVVPVSPCGPGHILRGGHCWPAATAPIVVPSTSVAVPVSRCGPSQILRGGHCVWPSQLLTNTLRSPGLYHPPLRVGPPTIRRPFVPAPRPTFGRRPFRWPM
jgi:hypothetical protein